MIVLRKPQQSVLDYFTDLCSWYRPYTTSHSNLPVLKITTSRISPKWDVAWFFPWEWKTAEFYSKDIDSAVENTLVSLQGLSFSKILSLILIHVNDEYFAPTRTAVHLRAYYIPAYITADILRKTTQRLSMDLSNEDIFCQGPKCTLFCSYWTFSELKKVVNFLSWFVPNWYKKFRSAYANK